MKKTIILLAFLFLCLCNHGFAQKYDYRVKAGFNIGGTSPIPLPREIRKISGYRPTLSLCIGADVERHINSLWSVQSGLKLETKGMSAKAKVKNYQTTMNISDGDETGAVSGMFTGVISTKVKNEYLTVPALGVYRLTPRWTINGGLFFSYLLSGSFGGFAEDGYMRDGNPIGEKVGVSEASYDFSKEIRKFNWGAQVGAIWKVYRHFSVYGDMTMSVNSIFKKNFDSISFDMYNAYLNIGFAYTF